MRRQRAEAAERAVVAWVAARGCPRPSQPRRNREPRIPLGRCHAIHSSSVVSSEREREREKERDPSVLVQTLDSLVSLRRGRVLFDRSILRENYLVASERREASVFRRGGSREREREGRKQSRWIARHHPIEGSIKEGGSSATYAQPTGDSFKVTRYPTR